MKYLRNPRMGFKVFILFILGYYIVTKINKVKISNIETHVDVFCELKRWY